ncbi:MAG: lactonase family protein, partial [Gemmataceae bacterium]|nr:lactonase family protein [Gemmataceae bacterium]
ASDAAAADKAAADKAAGAARVAAYWVYLGTYTGGDGGSKGIYRSKLDAKEGKLSEPELAAELASPSFLAVSPDNKYLYAVGETGGKDGGGVFAFAIDRKTGGLTKLNEATSGGPGPCHISLNRTGRFAGVANYGGGSAAFFKVGEDGKLGERVAFFQNKGSSVNKDRQEGPHAHCVGWADVGPTGETAYVVDLGLDQVLAFNLDHAKGTVTPADPPAAKLPPGSGPRHIAFNPNSGKAYVCGELDSTLITLRQDRHTGRLEPTDKPGAVLSTLPADTPADVRKRNSTAEVLVHPNKGLVLVSNRGHDSIAVFRVNADGTEAAGHVTGDIKTPRNFNVDPSGKWLLVASQDGNKVGVWELDATAGSTKETGNTIKVGRPVCVKFVPAG